MSNNPTIEPVAFNAMHDMLASAGYSDKAIAYYLDKPNMGKLANADQVSEVTGECGDTMRVYLIIADGVIQDAKFEVMGCPGAVAAAMAVADMVKGVSLADARLIRDADIFRSLVVIPDQKQDCIRLAAKTLQRALEDYQPGNGRKP
jgi:nitrogen fixation NifU-like protein